MQKRHLIPLAAATVVLVALAIVALAVGDRGVSRAAPGERAFPGLAGKARRHRIDCGIAQRLDDDVHP